MPPTFIDLTEDQRAEVETLAALLNQDQIADYFGISRTTFIAMRRRDADIDARYKRGKAKAIAHVAKGLLMKACAGDTVSSIFYLKTQGGWRETAAVEHQVDPGVTQIVRQMVSPRQHLKALIDAQAERLAIVDAVAEDAP